MQPYARCETAIAGLSLPRIAQVPSSLEPCHTVGFHTDIDSNQIFISVHAGDHADGHARHGTKTAPTVDAGPEAGGCPSNVPHGGVGHTD
jgi:hypothetical protein